MHTVAAVAQGPWRWEPHPEVWLLIAGLAALWVWAARVIGPKVVEPGAPVVTRRQIGWLATGLVLLWVATDWPVHDVGENYLYSAHMIQHMMLAFIAPPLLLLATPTWLARAIVGDGWFAGHVVRRACHPIVAGVVFNAVTVFLHWPVVVNESVTIGPLHYGLHVLLVTSALFMWMPVCGPLPELRLSLPGQMLYLFLMSVVPTVPAAWLTFADGVVYEAYDRPFRLWGLTATTDQQAAGLLMKLGGGMYLWTLIFVLFFKWAKRHEEAERTSHLVGERDILTWDQVRDELEHAGPAPPER